MKIIFALLSLAIWLPTNVIASKLETFSFTYAVNYSIAKGSMKLTLSKVRIVNIALNRSPKPAASQS